MRAPSSELPIILDNATVRVRGSTILDSVTLTFTGGAPTVLIGPNGAGKTTLLRLLMGLSPASSGRVTWGGRDSAPAEHRAIVFQRPVMLRRSAAANVRYALADTRSDNARIAELLALVGLQELEKRPARRLSGGEQQRLALARALARDPAVLLLDEPAASLDPAATKAIEDIIRAVAARGVKVVMSTHDLGQARRIGGEVVLLHRGRVVETAPAETFFSAPRTDAARRFAAGELLI